MSILQYIASLHWVVGSVNLSTHCCTALCSEQYKSFRTLRHFLSHILLTGFLVSLTQRRPVLWDPSRAKAPCCPALVIIRCYCERTPREESTQCRQCLHYVHVPGAKHCQIWRPVSSLRPSPWDLHTFTPAALHPEPGRPIAAPVPKSTKSKGERTLQSSEPLSCNTADKARLEG